MVRFLSVGPDGAQARRTAAAQSHLGRVAVIAISGDLRSGQCGVGDPRTPAVHRAPRRWSRPVLACAIASRGGCSADPGASTWSAEPARQAFITHASYSNATRGAGRQGSPGQKRKDFRPSTRDLVSRAGHKGWVARWASEDATRCLETCGRPGAGSEDPCTAHDWRPATGHVSLFQLASCVYEHVRVTRRRRHGRGPRRASQENRHGNVGRLTPSARRRGLILPDLQGKKTARRAATGRVAVSATGPAAVSRGPGCPTPAPRRELIWYRMRPWRTAGRPPRGLTRSWARQASRWRPRIRSSHQTRRRMPWTRLPLGHGS